MPQRCLGCTVRTISGQRAPGRAGSPGPPLLCLQAACFQLHSSQNQLFSSTSVYSQSLLPTGLLLVPGLRAELGWVSCRDGESLLLLQPSAMATSTCSAPQGRVQGWGHWWAAQFWGQNRALQPAHPHIRAGPFLALPQ